MSVDFGCFFARKLETRMRVSGREKQENKRPKLTTFGFGQRPWLCQHLIPWFSSATSMFTPVVPVDDSYGFYRVVYTYYQY